jgi:hypothetical protein
VSSDVSKEGAQMKAVESHFISTIGQLAAFTLAATTIVQEIAAIAPKDLQFRCEELSGMQKKFNRDNELFFEILEFVGPSVLDIDHIGEFQRALDKSIAACDILYAVVLEYRINLASLLS